MRNAKDVEWMGMFPSHLKLNSFIRKFHVFYSQRPMRFIERAAIEGYP
jgi:hypothetical protein